MLLFIFVVFIIYSVFVIIIVFIKLVYNFKPTGGTDDGEET